MDWAGDRSQETQAVLKVPDARTGERVPLQRLRLEAEALGVGEEFKFNRKAGENMVPEQKNEEQEEQSKASSATAEQQQQFQQQQRQPSHKPPSQSPASRGQPSRIDSRQWFAETPSVTHTILWGSFRPSSASPSPWCCYLNGFSKGLKH